MKNKIEYNCVCVKVVHNKMTYPFEKQFEEFWGLIAKCVHHDGDTKKIMLDAWKTVSWSATAAQPAPAEEPAKLKAKIKIRTLPKPQKQSGYMRFMNHMIHKMDDDGFSYDEKLSRVGDLWVALPESEKKSWHDLQSPPS
jgi:hypothetical protein